MVDFRTDTELNIISYILKNEDADLFGIEEKMFKNYKAKMLYDYLEKKYSQGKKADIKEIVNNLEISKEEIKTIYNLNPLLFDFEHEKKELIKYYSEDVLKFISEGLQQDNLTVEEKLELVEKKLTSLNTVSEHSYTYFEDIASKTSQRAREARERLNSDDLIGITTGYLELDKVTNGFRNNHLITVAGATGMGKTTLALNLILSHAKAGKKVGLFSFEMTDEEITNKMISNLSKIDLTRIEGGYITNEEIKRLEETEQQYSNLPIIINDNTNLNIHKLKKELRYLKRKENIDIAYIDHIGLMVSGQNRLAEITEITGELKKLQKELNIPIVMISQISRAYAKREDKEPQLADLRDSGSIEQDSNIVIFVHREDYQEEETNNQINILVKKNRGGSLRKINAGFDGATSNIYSLDSIENH